MVNVAFKVIGVPEKDGYEQKFVKSKFKGPLCRTRPPECHSFKACNVM